MKPIEFEFNNSVGIKSPLKSSDPKYFNFPIDINKVLDKLFGNGEFLYTPSEFLFDANAYKHPLKGVIDYRIKYTAQDGTSKTFGAAIKLNSRVGKIDTNKQYLFDFEIDPKKSAGIIIDIYKVKISYTDHDKLFGENKYAIVISVYSYDDFIFLLKIIHHQSNIPIEDYIYDFFESALAQYGKNSIGLIAIYREAPFWVIQRRDQTLVHKDLGIILKDSITGSDEEVVLKIFQSFQYESTDVNKLNIIQTEKINRLFEWLLILNDDSKTNFELLYNKINDFGGEDNFTTWIKLLYILWLNSKYAIGVDLPINDAPDVIIIDYKSHKILGFYSSNYDLEFNREFILVTEVREIGSSANLAEKTSDPVLDTFAVASPHLFQPINVPRKQSNGELKQPQNIIPAFFLKAISDKNLTDNFEKAAWLSLDVISTATGVGNLLKLRHLVRLKSTLSIIKIAIAGIEVASGTVGVLLNFIDNCDDENGTCSKIRTFLIYLDLATLGVDGITSALLRKSAREALYALPDEIRLNHPEVYEDLKNIAKGNKIPRELKEKIESLLKKYNFDVKFNSRNVDIITSKGETIARIPPNKVELYLDLYQMSFKNKNKLKKLINDANDDIRNTRDIYLFNPKDALDLGYKVPRSKNGFAPDFKNTKYLYNKKSSIKINCTFDRAKDEELAWGKLGITDKKTQVILKEKYVWHHLDDLDENLEMTMQLVEIVAHLATRPHIGSPKQYIRLLK